MRAYKLPRVSSVSSLRRDNESWSFLDILIQLRRFKVSDPRDRAYSALGLATDLTSDAIVPDYNKSVVVVYMEMAQFLIRNAPEGHKLDILGLY